MPTRSSSLRRQSLARKQKKYVLESESEDDDETKDESTVFGGVLATLKNDTNSRNRRATRSNSKSSLKNLKLLKSSPPKKKSTNEDLMADENGRTPPPRSIMTRATMRAISPLTTQKPRATGRKQKVPEDTSSSEYSSQEDSFASENDDAETVHRTLSSAEEEEVEVEEKSRSSYEDSYPESESSSEFEFQGDDEEFIPDNENEEDDESAAMSEFIVDDASDEDQYRSFAKNLSRPKNTINDDDDDDANSTSDEDGTSEIEEDDCVGTECASFDLGGHHTEQIAEDIDNEEIDDDNGSESIEETPSKPDCPRKTLRFDSPELQMAMVLDEEEASNQNDDVLFATIVESNSVDGDTVVLTFDEEEEEGSDASNHEEPRTEIREDAPEDDKISDDDVQRMSASSTSSAGQERTPEKDIGLAEKYNSPRKVHMLDEKPPLSAKKSGKKKIRNQYRQEGEVKRGKWVLGAKIGIGSFGTVHVGMNKKTGVLMAVKKFKMEGAIMEDIRTEVELMRSLEHTNIVRYLGAQMDEEYLHIFQEWVPGGSVSSLLSKFGAFSIEVIQSYISQTLDGLNYLHDNDIMHRDIKGSNILVNDEGVVKLADFGASKKLNNLAANMMMSLTVRGTPYFMAPEVFEEKYSAKADVWGIGCVAFQMVTSLPPWKELGFTNPISLFNHIKKNKGSPPMEHPEKESFSTSEEASWTLLQDFVDKCFEQDPSKRPTVKELLNDPFILGNSDVHNDDDESTHYCGIFSPRNEGKTLFSPKQLSLSAKRRSTQSQVLSSPSPKKTIEVEALGNSKTPSNKPKVQSSPSPDAREWPAWAKSHLEKQNNAIEHRDPLESREKLHDDVSALMDSLALSEDSSVFTRKLSTERRSSTMSAGSTVNSNLVGLNFLESTRNSSK